MPLDILTDNGSNFVSVFTTSVFKALGIDHIKTSPYHPQTKGALERFHHTLMHMACKCSDLQSDWDENLHLFLFACREAKSSATGFSPFELTYGEYAHGPLDILWYAWIPTTEKAKDAADWILEFRKSLSEMRNILAANQDKVKDYSKEQYDKKEPARTSF